MKTPSFIAAAVAATSLMLSACASEFDYKTSDSVALLRANDEAIYGIPDLSSDSRNYSTRSSASLTGLQSELGWR